MLIDRTNILSCFREHLTWATDIDIATAWATSNAGLRLLQQIDPPVRVRAVVGLWGNLSEPITLRTLTEIGQLRLVNATRQFHPKVFLFKSPSNLVAWVGSANFTAGGFGRNEEILYETTNAQTVAEWFDQLWSQCGMSDENNIDEYTESRLRNPPREVIPPPLATAVTARPMELLQNAEDWQDYMEALEQCDRWWSNNYRWSVLGEGYSWSSIIQKLHEVIARPNWNSLNHHEQQCLLGLTGGEWALLGNMRPRGDAMQTVFVDHCLSIQKIVQDIIAKPESAFPKAAVYAYEQLTSIGGVGKGIATRLLTLARPDRFVSLNRASEAGLAKLFAVPQSTLGKPQNYGRLLERIYNKNWYSHPRPVDAHEETIWWMRAALLDCFVYAKQFRSAWGSYAGSPSA